MANSSLRREVLECFKKLHRTRLKVFSEDLIALHTSREKINKEFIKCKHVTDPIAIQELIKFANECESILRTTVIQGKKVADNKYQLKITEDTVKLDNVPFSDCDVKTRKKKT